jgi:hypothetical protein
MRRKNRCFNSGPSTLRARCLLRLGDSFPRRHRRCPRTNSQPAPSQRSQVPARANPVAEQAGHSFQSVFRISRTFLPAHRFPSTILPHSPSIRVALYDGAPQCVHRATGFGLSLMGSCLSVQLPRMFRTHPLARTIHPSVLSFTFRKFPACRSPFPQNATRFSLGV